MLIQLSNSISSLRKIMILNHSQKKKKKDKVAGYLLGWDTNPRVLIWIHVPLSRGVCASRNVNPPFCLAFHVCVCHSVPTICQFNGNVRNLL